ncbi:hypothetical protein ACJRO7_035259 [Eucalyptus globulus]|uniref:Protein SIEVE ELEMENT OCCLUSION B-like n=1 Tax=Eucalyptus globulus TaxID=34317 RepID=A0ABD3J8G3_EUCGL
MMAMSDKDLMVKQVKETHVPDDVKFAAEPVLKLVDHIFELATSTDKSITLEGSPDVARFMKDETYIHSIEETLKESYLIINRISCMLSANALTWGDPHGTTLAILNMLATFSWETKLVATLAAFAFDYGKFWLLAQDSSNQLARAIATLKRLPTIKSQLGELKSQVFTTETLIQDMRSVARSVVQIKEFPSSYMTDKVCAFSDAMALLPMAVYWTIRSTVACASWITKLTSFGPSYFSFPTHAELNISHTTEGWGPLGDKLKEIRTQLGDQIDLCREQGEETLYQNLESLFKDDPPDNLTILKALINPRGDFENLHDRTKGKVDIDVLWSKNVLLLISGLDISEDKLSILEKIHSECKSHATGPEIHQYEMVWIPGVDINQTDQMPKRFKELQSMMPWYTAPQNMEKWVIRFIKEKWHFRGKPILVVLDPQGKVVCPNAIHMIWIWGMNAFPFTTETEEALWKAELWRLELLVNKIDKKILDWIEDEKYIFLYGGDDIEWIRKFTAAAHQVAQAARIPLEMVYVGKSNKREQVQRAIDTINDEKLSYTWQYLTLDWFWTRLESMLSSKIQLGKVDEHDLLMQQLERLLSFDKAGGWAILSKGSSIVVNGHGTTVLPALLEYDQWKEHVPTKGYDVAFKEHHDKIHDVTRPCCRFEFQSTGGRIPESMRCPECQRLMEKLTTFGCCHEEVIPTISE